MRATPPKYVAPPDGQWYDQWGAVTHRTGTIEEQLRFPLWMLTSFRELNAPGHIKGLARPPPSRIQRDSKARPQSLKDNAITFVLTCLYIRGSRFDWRMLPFTLVVGVMKSCGRHNGM